MLQTCKSYSLWLATSGVIMLMTQIGIMGGWASPNLPYLLSSNSTIPLNSNEASWVASSLNLGRLAGAFMCTILIDLIGTRKSVLFAFFPVSLGWILLVVANSVEWLLASRFISGISFRILMGTFSLYLGEISEPATRGTLISISVCGSPIGTLLGTIFETYLPMQISSVIYLIPCLVCIILFSWLPDTPFHLVNVKDSDRARESIVMYRRSCFEVENELKEIKNFCERDAEKTLLDKLVELKYPAIRKCVILTIMIFMYPLMCGWLNIPFYMEIILTNAKVTVISPQSCVIYANIVSAVSTVFGIRLSDKLGRRVLMAASGLGTAIALFGLSIHFYMINWGVDVVTLQWLPILSILIFTLTFTFGFMTVPSTVLSEIFPSHLKSFTACVASLSSALFGFVTAKSYQPLVDRVGEAHVFLIHAVFSITAVAFAVFYLPETKAKTFQEIQDQLSKT